MAKKKRLAAASTCPCGSGKAMGRCCEPLLNGSAHAATAEALMRSRYLAYVKGNTAYLNATWHAFSRPTDLELEQNCKWVGLQVLETTKGGEQDSEGWVKFVARYKLNGKAHKLEEYSYFVRSDGNWMYHSAK